jgi:hypothetical protein
MKIYDIIYNAGSSFDFHSYHKNWPLAKKSFEALLNKMDLRILVVGRTPSEKDNLESENIDYKPFMPHHEFLNAID